MQPCRRNVEEAHQCTCYGSPNQRKIRAIFEREEEASGCTLHRRQVAATWISGRNFEDGRKHSAERYSHPENPLDFIRVPY